MISLYDLFEGGQRVYVGITSLPERDQSLAANDLG